MLVTAITATGTGDDTHQTPVVDEQHALRRRTLIGGAALATLNVVLNAGCGGSDGDSLPVVPRSIPECRRTTAVSMHSWPHPIGEPDGREAWQCVVPDLGMFCSDEFTMVSLTRMALAAPGFHICSLRRHLHIFAPGEDQGQRRSGRGSAQPLRSAGSWGAGPVR